MAVWISRYLSLDDLLSVIGYAVFLGISRLSSHPPDLASVSTLASGMLAILWIASGNLRARNIERNPNVRVLFWALVAGVSILVGIR